MNYDKLKLDNQLCFRLYAASRLITQAYRPHLDKLGVTYPQYLVLMVLWETDSLPVNDIAKKLALETNTVTPLIQRMEREGSMVTRFASNRWIFLIVCSNFFATMVCKNSLSQRFSLCSTNSL